ncbi:HNH endonuclease [Streptomyces sp. NPDC004610]|uniref:HNH endonuclease n=1 Tax=unclassified Streptomyces TaxID=2593676 RepID=UPI0033B4BE79
MKPEFWEDEVVGLLPRDARLLFISTFNMADDEGLLRWTPSYIKAQTFMYDDDVTLKYVEHLMGLLSDAGLVFPYIGGVARQQMAVVVNFRKHQRINRPQKSKLPPPSLGNYKVREMYARRDGWVCQLCGLDIPRLPVVNDDHNLSIDHIRPPSAGGSDHPSNVRAAHQACVVARRDTPEEEFVPPRSLAGIEASVSDSLNRSVNTHDFAMNDSLNGSVKESDTWFIQEPSTATDSDISSLNHSLTEGKGKEGKGREEDPPQPPAEPSGNRAVSQTGEKPLPDRMTDAFLDRFARGNSYKRRQVRSVIADTLANGTEPGELWRAVERLGDTSKPVTANTLQFAFSEIRRAAQAANVIQLPTGQALTGTDERVAGWAALATPPRSEDSA